MNTPYTKDAGDPRLPVEIYVRNAAGELVPLATAAGLAVAGAAYSAVATFARPADVSAYAANDVLGAATGSTAALAFAGLGPAAGGEVLITGALLEIDVAALPAGMTSFHLECYGAAPPSAYGDNAAWDLPAGDRGVYLGTIPLGAPVDKGSTLFVETLGLTKPMTIPAGGAIQAYLVTDGGYTPTSAAVHKITLKAAGF